jgi:nitrogen fixation NifU-like protein
MWVLLIRTTYQWEPALSAPQRAVNGDVMKLQIRVDETTGIIEDAKFKTYGCGSAIASSSLVTEWLKGKTIIQAGTIKNSDIAEDAVKAAIADYQGKESARCACK